jgi:hypothetical protein
MRDQRVPFHLSESHAARALPALHGLLRHRIDRARRAHLVLVRDHVPQALVVHDAHEDLHLNKLEKRMDEGEWKIACNSRPSTPEYITSLP